MATPVGGANRARRAGWAAMAAAIACLLVVATMDRGGAETDSERIQRLSESFACPQCRGESVADSTAAVAATIREFIADEVSAGSTDTEIRDQLVRAYQGRILRNPPAEGLGALVWMLPVMLIVGGAAGIGTMVGRGRRDTVQASEADRELVRLARLAVIGTSTDIDLDEDQ
jgi:cytochrome c-type biogenesis protein CcmH